MRKAKHTTPTQEKMEQQGQAGQEVAIQTSISSSSYCTSAHGTNHSRTYTQATWTAQLAESQVHIHTQS